MAQLYHQSVRCLFGLLYLVGCAAEGRNVEVVVQAGDQPESEAVVILHRPDGERISTAHVDASGRAAMMVADDSLVTALFPHDYLATRLITVAVDPVSDQIVIHGPPRPSDLPIIGTIKIAPVVTLVADDFWVRISLCGALTMTWPVSIDLDASCIGTDSRVPVIIVARQNGRPIAYAAGIVALENGGATFEPGEWFPFAPNVPVNSDGVTATIDWTLWVDGLPVGPDDATSGGLVWQGVSVERATVHARIGDYTSTQITTREIASSPTAVTFEANDFLPPIAQTLVASGLPTRGRSLSDSLSFSWTPVDLDADVVNLRLGWLSRLQTSVIWDIVLPPDASRFTSPRFEDELADLTPRDDPNLVLRYIDSPELTGFESSFAARVYAVDRSGPGTIVPPPIAGQIRESLASGFVP